MQNGPKFFVFFGMKQKSSSEAIKDEATGLVILEQILTKVKKENWRIAEEKVIAYEANRGWTAEKVENCGYDILSIKGGQQRHIEVKSKLGTKKKFGWTELTANETKQFRADPDYFLYLVEGESVEPNDPFIIIELDKGKLEKIAQEYIIVRFTKLGSIERITVQC